MYYLQLIPVELIELLIPHLDVESLQSLLTVYSFVKLLKWSTIFTYHFGYYKNVDIQLYIKYLSVQQLQSKSNNHKLSKLPKLPKMTIEEILNLQELDLSYNQLKEIPKEIFTLTNLQKLGLSNNQLTEVPKEIFTLTNLQVLNLYNNQLTELPKEIGNLTNLQILYLYNNKLKIDQVPENLRSITNI